MILLYLVFRGQFNAELVYFIIETGEGAKEPNLTWCCLARKLMEICYDLEAAPSGQRRNCHLSEVYYMEPVFHRPLKCVTTEFKEYYTTDVSDVPTSLTG